MVQIRRMGPQIGVEVSGVDVKVLDDAGFAPIYQAWLDHNDLRVFAARSRRGSSVGRTRGWWVW